MSKVAPDYIALDEEAKEAKEAKEENNENNENEAHEAFVPKPMQPTTS